MYKIRINKIQFHYLLYFLQKQGSVAEAKKPLKFGYTYYEEKDKKRYRADKKIKRFDRSEV